MTNSHHMQLNITKPFKFYCNILCFNSLSAPVVPMYVPQDGGQLTKCYISVNV